MTMPARRANYVAHVCSPPAGLNYNLNTVRDNSPQSCHHKCAFPNTGTIGSLADAILAHSFESAAANSADAAGVSRKLQPDGAGCPFSVCAPAAESSGSEAGRLPVASGPVRRSHASTFAAAADNSIQSVTGITSSVTVRGASSCGQYSADRSPGQRGTTGRNCSRSPTRLKLLENQVQNLSDQSDTSTDNASASATSRAWRGQTRPKPTSLTSRASIRAHAAVGYQEIPNHQPMFSEQSSARS